MEELAYVGKVLKVEPIEGADRIHLAHVVCGKGGLWRGVTPKTLGADAPVVVFLPDALVPKDHPALAFMEQHKWRVRQRRFKGVPSESVILPLGEFFPIAPDIGPIAPDIGTDITEELGVTKYEKPMPVHFAAEAVGDFPWFVPKTDEPNFQRVPQMLEAIKGQPYYITVKVDGMSSTAFRYKDHFGVCSRNLEIKDGPNAIWNVVRRYQLQERLPEGLAVQWETVGPGIQKNPLGLKEVDGYVFQVWDINEKCYLPRNLDTRHFLDMPWVQLMKTGDSFDYTGDELQKMAEGAYSNGKQREGIVIRPQTEQAVMFERLSFKVINLLYKD